MTSNEDMPSVGGYDRMNNQAAGSSNLGRTQVDRSSRNMDPATPMMRNQPANAMNSGMNAMNNQGMFALNSSDIDPLYRPSEANMAGKRMFGLRDQGRQSMLFQVTLLMY